MAIDFPNSPSLNQTFTVGQVTWKWDGSSWKSTSLEEIQYLQGVTSSVQTQLDGKQALVSGVSSTEIGYLDGVTSAIQTQINSKQNNVITTQGDLVIGNASNQPARLAVGTSGQVLTSNGTTATWQTASAGVGFEAVLLMGGF